MVGKNVTHPAILGKPTLSGWGLGVGKGGSRVHCPAELENVPPSPPRKQGQWRKHGGYFPSLGEWAGVSKNVIFVESDRTLQQPE